MSLSVCGSIVRDWGGTFQKRQSSSFSPTFPYYLPTPPPHPVSTPHRTTIPSPRATLSQRSLPTPPQFSMQIRPSILFPQVPMDVDPNQSTPTSLGPPTPMNAPGPAELPIHTGISCDVCNLTIRGVRHKCLDCPSTESPRPCRFRTLTRFQTTICVLLASQAAEVVTQWLMNSLKSRSLVALSPPAMCATRLSMVLDINALTALVQNLRGLVISECLHVSRLRYVYSLHHKQQRSSRHGS